jgi:glycosyltransferase involved in cell wall biosynthesis
VTASAEPLVSIVTPFYNTEAYLAECIESVLAQTYTRFEYILLNNRSTDRSVEIAERYLHRDPRLRLVHNERFLTQLQNYNQALRLVSADARYVKMVQADDSLFPRCLSDMVAVADAYPSVAVVSSYRMLGSDVYPTGLPHTKVVMTGREACRFCLIDDLSLFGSQTTVMMRADVVRSRDPFYGEDRLFPDSDAVYEILLEHDFAFVHQVLSFSRTEDGSTWGRMRLNGPTILDRLIRLKAFGPLYLSPEECARLTEQQERVYRRFLASAWLNRREPEFWEFHRKGLACIGEKVERAELLRYLLPTATYQLLRPLARRARQLIRGT